MKNQRTESGCAIVFWIILFVAVVAAVYGYGYLIATSDMPDWLKFFLLK